MLVEIGELNPTQRRKALAAMERHAIQVRGSSIPAREELRWFYLNNETIGEVCNLTRTERSSVAACDARLHDAAKTTARRLDAQVVIISRNNLRCSNAAKKFRGLGLSPTAATQLAMRRSTVLLEEMLAIRDVDMIIVEPDGNITITSAQDILTQRLATTG